MVEVTGNGPGCPSRERGELADEQHPPALEKAETASMRMAALEQEIAALRHEVLALRDAERLASAQSQAIARTLEMWIANPSIEVFAAQVLLAIAEQLGAKDAALWLHDEERRSLTLHLSFEDGQLRTAADGGHPGWASHADDENANIHRLKVGQEAFVLDAEFIDTDASMARYRDYLRQRRTRTILVVPMFLGEVFFGSYTVSHDYPRTYTDAEFTLAKALAGQAMLAMHTARLAEQAKQAAIAREQEEAATRRAAELAKANAALKTSIAALAGDGEIDAFLSQVLRSITDHFDSPSSALWLFQRDNPQMVSLALVYEPKGVTEGASHVLKGTGEVMDMRNGAAHQRILRGEQVVMEVATYAEILPEQRAYLISRGTETLLSTPIVIGDNVLGAFVLDFCDKRIFDVSELELARALSNQAALALELTYRAEQAKQAAIAREQEEAATRRAEVLARANAAMAKTVGRLVERPDIRNFVGEVLSVFATEFDAVGVEFWQYIDAATMFTPSLSFDRATATLTGDENEWKRMDAHRSERMNQGTVPTLAGRINRLTPRDFDTLPEFAPFREKLREQAIQTILSVPMFIRDECFGVICMRLDHDRILNASEEELAFALAQQLALALQLTRLAEEAKQAAIAREQEEAASRRAEVLARANAAMAKTVGRLVEQPDIRNFVGEVLSVFATEFQALGAEFWGYDRDQDQFDVVLSFEASTGAVTGEENEWQKLNRRIYPQDRARENATRAHRINHVGAQEIYTSPTLAPFREKLRAQGVRTILSIPVFLKEECLGAVCLRLDHDRTLNSAEEELAFALAQQLALALQLTRLAEEAKQAAIAREQEEAAQQRVAQLAKANAILRSTVDVMTSIPALDEFLGTVMLAINESLGARGSTFWMFDFAQLRSELAMTAIEGSWSRTPPVYGDATLPSAYPLPPEYVEGFQGNGRWLFTRDIQQHSLIDDSTRRWLKHLGIVALHEYAIVVGRRVIGTLVVHCEVNEPFPTEKLELAVVLAQQLGLAIHITRLAEEAKQTAIARERERAALDQAAELVKANRAISSSLAKLAAYPDVEAFLGQILLSITTHLGEQDGGVWLFDRALDRLTLRLSLEDGVLVRDGFHIDAQWLKFDGAGEMQDGDSTKSHGFRNEVVIHTPEEIQTHPVWAPYREVLKQGGFLCTMEVPMFVGEELIGFYAVRAKHHRTFSAAEIELAQALTHQAALACHVRGLAAETAELAQQTAVSEERNRLARDIHDTLAQGFAAIGMQLQGATRERASLPRAVRPYLERALVLTRENLAEARRSVGALRSPDSSPGGFVPTLTRIIEQARGGSAADIELNVSCHSLSIPRNVEDELLRIAQEALTNAIKHAGASRITIDVTEADRGLRLKIQDDGTGFNADMPTAGYGLGIMQERAKRVGATLTLITEPNHGTEAIAVWSPQPESSERHD